MCLYQPGPAVLLSRGGSPGSPGPFDTEHSANSEGSHETGDSGRFSHESNDEIHLSAVPGASPAGSSDSNPGSPAGSGCAEPPLLFPGASGPLQIHPAVPN